MTRVVVMSGSCGLTTAISAEKTHDRSVAILVGSGCAMVEVTGGRLLLQDDPVKAADAIEAHIVAKRKALGFDA